MILVRLEISLYINPAAPIPAASTTAVKAIPTFKVEAAPSKATGGWAVPLVGGAGVSVLAVSSFAIRWYVFGKLTGGAIVALVIVVVVAVVVADACNGCLGLGHGGGSCGLSVEKFEWRCGA